MIKKTRNKVKLSFKWSSTMTLVWLLSHNCGYAHFSAHLHILVRLQHRPVTTLKFKVAARIFEQIFLLIHDTMPKNSFKCNALWLCDFFPQFSRLLLLLLLLFCPSFFSSSYCLLFPISLKSHVKGEN